MTCARDIKPAPTALPDDLIEVAEVAQLTGRSKRTVRRWAQKKLIRHFERFGRLYFSRRDVDATLIEIPEDPSK